MRVSGLGPPGELWSYPYRMDLHAVWRSQETQVTGTAKVTFFFPT